MVEAYPPPLSLERSKQMDYIPKVLEQVNEIRQALAIGEGKLPELPKGVPGFPEQCVLARALSNGWKAAVTGPVVYFRNPKLSIKELEKAGETLTQLGWTVLDIERNKNEPEYGPELPVRCTPEMRQLVSDFDSKRLPQFILED